MWRLALLLLVACGCTTPVELGDGGPTDASPDVAHLTCGSFSEGLSCPDASAGDAGTCASPQGLFTSDAGFAAGCVVTENDQSVPIDGACMTPIFTCVAGQWSLSWVPE